MASPPVGLDYPHWSDPVRLAECHFFDPPPRFQPPQPRKKAESAASRSTQASCSRSGGYPDSKKSGGSKGSGRSRSSAGSRGSKVQKAALTQENLNEHVREMKPWGGSNGSSYKKKDK